jgi:tetratricopeptide (TPR) repeat protein
MASWQDAQQFLQTGRHAPALASYQNLVEQFPNVSQLWAEMSQAAAANLDFTLANQASQRAADLAAADARMLVSIGQQYHHLGRLDQSCTCFVRAVTADPASAQARLNLAEWYERHWQIDQAWDSVQACLSYHPKNGHALYFQAFLLHRKGLDGEAEMALHDLLKSPSLNTQVSCSAKRLLAVVLDRAGQYAEALVWLGKAKKLMRQRTDAAPLERAYDRMDRARRELVGSLTPKTMHRWREEAGESPCPHALAFLGGPPRSGTTLLEQILAGHPRIMAFDEPQSFAQELVSTLQPPPPARGLTLKSLNAVDPAGRTRLMERYFKSLLRDNEEWPDERLLVDKNPSLTQTLHIWLRVFPQLKVIMALRDPRDVIISSYFQTPMLNHTTVNLLSLERTAKYYADCMDVWLRLRNVDGFDWIETRYEDTVANLEAEGRRVTNFLGLPWQAGQENFYRTARRKFVHAAAYHEVTRPVYNTSVGRWAHYQEALGPLQKSLEPYLRAFGYS